MIGRGLKPFGVPFKRGELLNCRGLANNYITGHGWSTSQFQRNSEVLMLKKLIQKRVLNHNLKHFGEWISFCDMCWWILYKIVSFSLVLFFDGRTGCIFFLSFRVYLSDRKKRNQSHRPLGWEDGNRNPLGFWRVHGGPVVLQGHPVCHRFRRHPFFAFAGGEMME